MDERYDGLQYFPLSLAMPNKHNTTNISNMPIDAQSTSPPTAR